MGNTGSIDPKPGQKYSVINVAFPGNTVDVHNNPKNEVGGKLGTWPYDGTFTQHHYFGDAYRGENTYTCRSELAPNVVYEEDYANASTIRNGVLNKSFDLPNQRWFLRFNAENNSYQIVNAGSGKAVTYMGNSSPTGVRCCAPDPNNLAQQWKISEI